MIHTQNVAGVQKWNGVGSATAPEEPSESSKILEGAYVTVELVGGGGRRTFSDRVYGVRIFSSSL